MCGVSRGRWLGTRGDRDARTRPRGGGCGSPGVCTSGPVPPPFGPPATKPGHLLRLAGRPRGTLTRNPPIYYFWAAPLDHTAAGKIKTAGDGLRFSRNKGCGRGVGLKSSRCPGFVATVFRTPWAGCPKVGKQVALRVDIAAIVKKQA